jgi:hypothetical protein
MKANVVWTALVAAGAAVVAGLLPDYAHASITPNQVPEPGTLSILAAGVGIGALALRRARRKK